MQSLRAGVWVQMAQAPPCSINRRNDIVHRADREKKAPDGDAQEIGYAWSRQTVDTIRVVCLCLDELVTARLNELRERAAVQPHGAA